MLGLALVAALAAFGWLRDIALPLPRLLLPAAAFLFYGAAGVAATRAASGVPQARRPSDPPAKRPPGPSIALIWAIAVLARLVLLPLAPELSDDIYRYLWDGHVLGHGFNPYAYPPAHDALADIRTPWHGEINHPDVSTIYPPLAQLLFAAVAVTGGGVLSAKALWVAFDLGCGYLLQRIAVRMGRKPAPVLVWYLWSPLLIVETAWSGHFDAVGLSLLAALILALACSGGTRLAHGRHGRAAVVGGLLGAAALVKFAPAAVLPAVVRRHGLGVAVALVAMCVVFYLPFTGVGPVALTEGLRTYARHWSANPGAFAVIGSLVENPVHARVWAALVVLIVVAYVAWRRFSVERALLWVIGAGLLLSPTVHPWYTLWVLPMAALRGNRPFLLLGGLAFLGYWGLAAYESTGIWPQPLWVRTAMWVPVWVLLAWEARSSACLR